MTRPKGDILLNLAYVDDSGVTDERCRYGVFAAVLLSDTDFAHVEERRDIVRDVMAETGPVIPEFKAHSLFRGRPPFEGIPESERFYTLELLLTWFVDHSDASVVYGAVDRQVVEKTVYASINPADVAFRWCVEGVEKRLRKYGDNRIGLIILDDTGDTGLKARLRKTYRALRSPAHTNGQVSHLHDDVYFGSSADSIGLQVADLCAYFIGLHLMGDTGGERFFQLFAEKIGFSSLFPKDLNGEITIQATTKA